MSISTLDVLEFDGRIAKRAQWEGFEFTILGGSEIEVVNSSYEDPEDHTYTVHIEAGIPSDCTCPAWEHHDGACKHMVAVAIREPVLHAATEEPRMKADGGAITEPSADDSPEEECWCEDSDFLCFKCFLIRRRELPSSERDGL